LSLLVIPGSLFTVCDRGKRRQYPSNSQVAIPFLPSLSRLARRVGSRRDRRPEQNPRPPSPGGWPTAPPPAPTSRPIPSNPVGIGTRVGNPYVVQQRAPSSAHRPGRELRAATCSAQRPGRELPDCTAKATSSARRPGCVLRRPRASHHRLLARVLLLLTIDDGGRCSALEDGKRRRKKITCGARVSVIGRGATRLERGVVWSFPVCP
jgi:hypothetical protein